MSDIVTNGVLLAHLEMEGKGQLPTPISLAFCCDAADAASAAWSVRTGKFLDAVPEAMMSSEFCGVSGDPDSN